MSKHIVIRRFVIATSALALLAIVPGCLVESQKASDVFANGQMPKSLEHVANQFHELANVVGLSERVQRESVDKTLLPIAIIDCGMDLAHPDLVQKIAFDFDIEKGQLVGAGFDFMGNDRWASANLINPLIYAIGADQDADGKLINVNEEPLEYLMKLNSEFMAILTSRIQADPVLSQSLYKNINSQSMNLIGAINVTQDRYYRPDTYPNWEKQGYLIDVDTRARMASDPAYFNKVVKANTTGELVDLLDQPWKVDPTSGTPQAGWYNTTINMMNLLGMKHADLFRALVVKTLTEFDAQSGILAKIETYKKLQANQAGFSKPMQGEELNELANALYIKTHGLTSLDPMTAFAAALRDATLREDDKKGKVFGRDFNINSVTLSDELDQNFSLFEETVKYLEKSGSKSPSVQKEVSDMKNAMGPMRELFDWYRQDRRLDSKLGANPKEGTPQYSLYRQYLMRNSIPYLSKHSDEVAHGTHTAGIVAAQDPSIRIVPVRVTTQGTASNNSETEKLKAKFKADFTAWLEIPLVFRALGNEVKDLDDSDYSDLNSENRRKVANIIAQAFGRKIDLEFNASPMEFQFLNEVTSAIRFVGERRIKIANISLGTSFSSVPTSLSDLSAREKLSQLFDYLKYEYYKYQIGLTIRTYAPQTLFVVASGNDGAWVDGVSRSALPMDISSPFLAAFEDAKKGDVAPNNNLSNILAVGSVNPDGGLSSFTNILIGSNTPYVLAHGESILSPVKTTDLESVTQLINSKVPQLLKPKWGNDASEILKNLYDSKVASALKDDERYSAVDTVKHRYEASAKLLQSLGEAVQLHMFLKYPNHRARMSGTSMATPAVTGIVGRMIIEKAKRLGISPQEIYDRPDFAPSTLIEDMFKKSQPLGGSGGRGIAMSTLMGDVKNEPTQGAIDLEQALDQAVSRGAENHCLRAKGPVADTFCE